MFVRYKRHAQLPGNIFGSVIGLLGLTRVLLTSHKVAASSKVVELDELYKIATWYVPVRGRDGALGPGQGPDPGPENFLPAMLADFLGIKRKMFFVGRKKFTGKIFTGKKFIGKNLE